MLLVMTAGYRRGKEIQEKGKEGIFSFCISKVYRTCLSSTKPAPEAKKKYIIPLKNNEWRLPSSLDGKERDAGKEEEEELDREAAEAVLRGRSTFQLVETT